MSKQLFPNPPPHYKQKDLTPPNEKILESIDTLRIFGKSIQVKNYEKFTFQVEFDCDEITEKDEISALKYYISLLKLKYIEFLKEIRKNIENCGTSLFEMRKQIEIIQTLIFRLKNKQMLVETKKYLSENVFQKKDELRKNIEDDLNNVKGILYDICDSQMSAFG
jgi:hypothetical protein